MRNFNYANFPNLSLPQFVGTEGLTKWTQSLTPYVDKFKDVIPTQPSFFIKKENLLDLCSGSGWLPNDSEVYALLFCVAYDKSGKFLYYRIRTISIAKTELSRSLSFPIPITVVTKIYTSPVALTVPNSSGIIGENCLTYLKDSDVAERTRLDEDVSNWKNTVKTNVNLKEFLPKSPNEKVYIGDIIGKKRILEIINSNPKVDGITLIPALYSKRNTNSLFIAIEVNPSYGTINEDGMEPLKCPPGSVDPCQNLH